MPNAGSARSVWSRVGTGSITAVVPAACSPASRTALLTWALATGGAYVAARNAAPRTTSGGRPPAVRMRAPIRSSGSTMRCIGRRRSEASPVMVVSNGRAARMPASRRIVVPELPASSFSCAGPSASTPRPPTVTVGPASPAASGSVRISTPSVRRQRSVDAQSAPGA